jgi:biopolymer transport protein ExbB
MITQMLPVAFTFMGQTPMQLFVHGGPIMWPIILVSFIMITVVIERIIFIIRENGTREPEVVEKMLESVDRNDIDGAVQIGKKSKDFVARILVYALSHKENALSAFLRASNQELTRFQQGMATLDTMITAAPLLGLLGTVTGMMKTFAALGTADISSSTAAITGGVGEALIATMVGLAIAIVGLLPFNYLNARAEEAKHEVADAANALELILLKKNEGASTR